jgi:hypothetical protein
MTLGLRVDGIMARHRPPPALSTPRNSFLGKASSSSSSSSSSPPSETRPLLALGPPPLFARAAFFFLKVFLMSAKRQYISAEHSSHAHSLKFGVPTIGGSVHAGWYTKLQKSQHSKVPVVQNTTRYKEYGRRSLGAREYGREGQSE